jgi:hypothetical protein
VGKKVKANISKVARRPRYFIANDICVKLNHITFVQKANNAYAPFSTGEPSNCSVTVGVDGQQPVVFIPCKDAIEQTAIFTQLATILSSLQNVLLCSTGRKEREP